MEDTKLKEAVSSFLDKNILLSPDVKQLEDIPNQLASNIHKQKEMLCLNKDLLGGQFFEKPIDMNWVDFDKARVIIERGGDEKQYTNFLNYLNDSTKKGKWSAVREVRSFADRPSKKEASDFTMYFNSRLSAIQRLLLGREELRNMTSINRINSRKDRDNLSLIGLVKNKETTKKDNLVLTIEDSTGEIKVLVNKNKPDLYAQAKDIVLDEVIGVTGVNGENIVFANAIVWPDIPASNELKKSDQDCYALFLSDLHVGSNNFLSLEFERFLAWVNGEAGNEKQREIASKVSYIFIVGDLVDGVGIYPGQEEDLAIKDIYAQYNECARFLAKIPQHIHIIICAGNHDAMRIAEPQPPFENEYPKALRSLQNVTLVSNPATVNIGANDKFEGYNVLLYHGYSFDYYIANVESIRNQGGYDRADLIMKFLLKRRHLAPTHTSTLYVPYTDMDPLFIDIVPDFFISGHIHKSTVSTYKNITLVCGSCWQSKTDFQEKMGHNPEPCRVPMINLATREARVLRFGK